MSAGMGVGVALLVGIGGAVGAVLRHLLATTRRGALAGVFVANVAGAALLGLLVALAERGAVPGWVLPLVGTGVCGALTTYSTLAVQTWELSRRGWLRAGFYLIGTVLIGLLAACVPILLLG